MPSGQVDSLPIQAHRRRQGDAKMESATVHLHRLTPSIQTPRRARRSERTAHPEVSYAMAGCAVPDDRPDIR